MFRSLLNTRHPGLPFSILFTLECEESVLQSSTTITSILVYVWSNKDSRHFSTYFCLLKMGMIIDIKGCRSVIVSEVL